jgi:hypothetical protein
LDLFERDQRGFGVLLGAAEFGIVGDDQRHGAMFVVMLVGGVIGLVLGHGHLHRRILRAERGRERESEQ